MDDTGKLVRTYAIALFECSGSYKAKKTAFDQLVMIQKAINNDEQLKLVIYSPVVDKTYKIGLLQAVASHCNMMDIVRNFLFVLIKNSRIVILSEIVSFLQQLLKEAKNIKDVAIISTKTLNILEKQQLKRYLEQKINSVVNIKYSRDPSIIGGVIIKYDSMLLDYSVKGAMEMIKKLPKSAK